MPPSASQSTSNPPSSDSDTLPAGASSAPERDLTSPPPSSYASSKLDTPALTLRLKIKARKAVEEELHSLPDVPRKRKSRAAAAAYMEAQKETQATQLATFAEQVSAFIGAQLHSAASWGYLRHINVCESTIADLVKQIKAAPFPGWFLAGVDIASASLCVCCALRVSACAQSARKHEHKKMHTYKEKLNARPGLRTRAPPARAFSVLPGSCRRGNPAPIRDRPSARTSPCAGGPGRRTGHGT